MNAAQDAPSADTDDHSAALAGAWLGLAIVLVVARAWVLQHSTQRRAGDPVGLGWIVVAVYQDLLLVFALALLAGFAQRHVQRRGARRALVVAAVLLATVLATYAGIAAQVLAYVGVPLTVRLLVLSDDLHGVRASLATVLTAERITFILAAPALVLLAAAGAHWTSARYTMPRRSPRRARGLLLGFAAYLLIAALAARQLAWNLVANPHLVLVASLLERDRLPLAVAAQVDRADFSPRPPSAHVASDRSGMLSGANVVLVVLESTGAARLAPWGASQDVAPELSRIASSGLVFERIYAQQPRTSNAMAALFCSIYPSLRRVSLPRHAPALAVPGLADVLLAAGYRTAFLTSSDLTFDDEHTFLDRHGFATVRDVHALTGAPATQRSAADPPAGGKMPARRSSDERSARCERRQQRRRLKHATERDYLLDGTLVPAAVDWIEADRSRPFFLVLWTIQTHHPYIVEQPEQPLAAAADLNRYLNALRETDRMLGELVRTLAARGLADSTLLIVTGDHGEAFGEHGVKFHGRSLYDEEVRVPLLLAHPLLGGGARAATLGQQVDVAPTVLDLLGIAAPPSWQGTSLFAPDHTGRAYLINVFDDTLFGLVDGDRKFLFDGSLSPYAVFDTASDPGEVDDRAQRPEEQLAIAVAQRRVASWLRSEEELLSQVDGKH